MTQFLNFHHNNNWRLDVIADISRKVLDYANSHGLKDVTLVSVEDDTWGDPANQRYNIEIAFDRTENNVIGQRLLMLKGEIIDGETFHKRYKEFYPE